MPDRSYDVVVIGAGPVGENVASRALAGGARVAIVESELVGGDCSYWACMPSKALLRPAQALAESRAVAGAAGAVHGGPDVAATLARRDEFTHGWDDASQVDWLDSAGIELVRGQGRLDGPRQVVVATPDGGDVTLGADHAVVICTGSRAAVPPVPGLAASRPWTSRDATAVQEVPARLAIIGGGVVASEMATLFSQLGARVTVIERSPRMLGGMPAFAGEAVADSLRAMGVEVLTSAEADQVERRSDGTVALAVAGRTIEADEVLAATGRAPRTHDLGLETVGLEPGTWLEVDDHLQVAGVTGAWLYAAGDVNHRALVTHMGKYQARVCGDLIAARLAGPADPIGDRPWGRFRASADHRAVPQVVFAIPEVASVGLDAAQARARGLDVVTAEHDLGAVAGSAVYADGYRGRAQMVVDTERRTVVGTTLVGPGVGELIHAATIAIVGEVPLERLRHAVPSFPTISEVWLRLGEELGV